jgi:type II secretory pathway predicted ATPase ExeA
MYNSYFGFAENPFNLTPDPRYLFLSTYHKEAIEHLLYGINERKGFIVITGGIGTGKTTLCRTLLNHLNADTKSALIFNSFISGMELLKSINQEFGISMPDNAGTRKDYIDALNAFLLDIFASGGNAILIIDEAQNLSHDVLEQIRMLSNLETAKEKLMQIVLVGQPELSDVLAAPSLRQLNERVMVRYDLRPLAFSDVRRYIEHRMVVAGGHGGVRFMDGAVKTVYFYSRGNPRRINNLCDRALLISFALEKHDVSKGIIKKAVKELYGGNILKVEPHAKWKSYALYASLIMTIAVAALLVMLLNKENRGTVASYEKAAVSKETTVQKPAIRMKVEKPSLFMDEQKSLSMLFSVFYGENSGRNNLTATNIELVSYNIAPEYYVTLKKPYRVVTDSTDGALKYLFIKTADSKGAAVVDSEGKEQLVDRSYIINNWGGQVSWVCAGQVKMSALLKGATTPEVRELQTMLNSVGYMVVATGKYDEGTCQEIMKFQKDFNLETDGIAGPRTRALLAHMVK